MQMTVRQFHSAYRAINNLISRDSKTEFQNNTLLPHITYMANSIDLFGYKLSAAANNVTNSPFLYKSIMMSQPPTNSPLIYN